MDSPDISLESILETHDIPFAVVNHHLRIVAVNRAWEASLGLNREHLVGQPCCVDTRDCRHSQLFKTLTPYSGKFPGLGAQIELDAQQSMYSVRGYPLLNQDSAIYAGEAIRALTKFKDVPMSVKMVGESLKFKALKERLQQAARIEAPVILYGETGTGKELAAEYIQDCAANSRSQMVVVDCTILSEELFESELFGHEKGAFTGATMAKKGLFEVANNGTIFLDEIGELPLSQQSKLLRVLETGTFRRIGSTSVISTRVRVICATHRDLAAMVKAGSFREDLFYRLSVFPINLPSLRDRPEDIPIIMDFLLAKMAESHGTKYDISNDAVDKLIAHQWPGNIRELKNCLQLATGLCQDATILESDIILMPARALVTEPELAIETVPIKKASKKLSEIEEIEVNHIRTLHKKFKGNRKSMAIEMNISERTLYRKLNRLNLHNVLDGEFESV